MKSAIVRLYNETQGFGILITDSGMEINFFKKDVIGEVVKGDKVHYQLSEEKGGKFAKSIQRV